MSMCHHHMFRMPYCPSIPVNFIENTPCACIPEPMAAQEGQVLTVVNNGYEPRPVDMSGFEGQQRPDDLGLIAWNNSPFLAGPDYNLNTHSLQLVKIFLHEPHTVSDIALHIMTNGPMTLALLGIYSETGQLLRASPDMGSTWFGSNGLVFAPIEPITLEARPYFIAMIPGQITLAYSHNCMDYSLPPDFNAYGLISQNTMDYLPQQIDLNNMARTCVVSWAGLA